MKLESLCRFHREGRVRQQPLRVVRGGGRRRRRGGACEGQSSLHPVERLPALPKTRPRVPPLRLPVEEEVARPVDQTAVHHPE